MYARRYSSVFWFSLWRVWTNWLKDYSKPLIYCNVESNDQIHYYRPYQVIGYDPYNSVLLQFSIFLQIALREKCLYSDSFCSVFSRIRAGYRILRSISPYSVWLRENTDQKNSEYGHCLRSVYQPPNWKSFWYISYCFHLFNAFHTSDLFL